MRFLPRNREKLILWYERYFSPVFLVAGFLSDNFILLRRVDLWRTNALLFFYLLVCGLGIIYINLVDEKRITRDRLVRIVPIVFIAMQFSFGGLFSGFLSLYSRSASLASSWIFVFLFAALLIGNERFIRLYRKYVFQLAMYFLCIFSFLIFFLPVLYKKVGAQMFLTSSVLSVLLIFLFLLLLRFLTPKAVVANRVKTLSSIGIIYVIFVSAYFLNIIPPLPLAIKSAGVYHSVSRSSDTYTLTGESVSWYDTFMNYNTTLHIPEGDPAYVYAAIFAPTGLSIDLVHEWQQYSTTTKSWQTEDVIRFPIVGGRDGGYRTYTAKTSIDPGQWRVNVRMVDGQLIGRVTFTVVYSDATTTLTTRTE